MKNNSQTAKEKGVSVTQCIKYQTIHICNSFSSKNGNHICDNVEICNPIKNALLEKISFVNNLGVIFCKYPHENLAYLIYNHNKEKLENEIKVM